MLRKFFAVEIAMNRNSYSEFAGNPPVSSQVDTWAQNWAETFRREAWQPDTAEAVVQPKIPESKAIAPKQPLIP
jgi:hypothetical protein